jgi:hypothetical protein
VTEHTPDVGWTASSTLAHLKDAVAQGDKRHEDALKAMKGRWKNPIGGMGWYMKTKKDLAALLED